MWELNLVCVMVVAFTVGWLVRGVVGPKPDVRRAAIEGAVKAELEADDAFVAPAWYVMATKHGRSFGTWIAERPYLPAARMAIDARSSIRRRDHSGVFSGARPKLPEVVPPSQRAPAQITSTGPGDDDAAATVVIERPSLAPGMSA